MGGAWAWEGPSAGTVGPLPSSSPLLLGSGGERGAGPLLLPCSAPCLLLYSWAQKVRGGPPLFCPCSAPAPPLLRPLPPPLPLGSGGGEGCPPPILPMLRLCSTPSPLIFSSAPGLWRR